MIARAEPTATRRLATTALLGAVTAAVASVPTEVLPWPWLVALVAPAVLFGRLPRALPWPLRWPPWRTVLGALLQIGACWLAWYCAGPLARPAALAGTILPPLGFVAGRRSEADATLALFLAFCVLLVATILGEPSAWLQCAFVGCAIVQLRCAARLHALHDATVRADDSVVARAQPLPIALGLAALAALAVEGLRQGLGWLPSLARPTTEAPAPLPPGSAADGGGDAHRTGLPDDFRLDGDGTLRDGDSTALVIVRSLDGAPVPNDLYLRSGVFEVAAVDQWRNGPFAAVAHDTARAPLLLHAAPPTMRRFALRTTAAARDLVFVPPQPIALEGIADLLADVHREWFRRATPGAARYLAMVAPDGPPLDAEVDDRWRVGGDVDLTALPDDLPRAPFARLLTEWRPRGSALAIAQTIGEGLQARCRYERREPRGPHGQPLLDFVDGDGVGYCMHFAASAAILLRLCGVPCRVAIGVQGGTPTTNGERVYGNVHAHAWVEIPLAGRGFCVFDPTPARGRGTGGVDPRADDDAHGATTAPAAAPLADAARWLQRNSDTPWPWLAVLALLALLPHRLVRRARHRGDRSALLARPARRWLQQIQKELTRAGAPRPHGVTLEAHARALQARGLASPDLLAAFAAYQDVRFGARPWDAVREQALTRGLAAARQLPTVLAPRVSARS